ncbi:MULTISPECIES: DUF5336 domain-containing protein [Mycolicibacterium]|uniref:Antigen 34 kDa n=2 Tax=Mycolicibacterium conceptionense TaxID=451644 RepID=A0A1A1XM56_9MYCO|nr:MULTISPECIES: DUF5336 domain-containing protein [Mycolicibacterium]MCW1823902.1 DUF5336 domain-containing protein [Mycolicibacterium senegalense]OBB06806.1 hypothetical protein A5718_00985 [Mycolicibacterium conceptionense]OBF20195.1 hypothetical protein A5726_15720 [Mycolicibacterium conceptionense]OBF47918.1 hypothetical protein A5720_02345 [Mycolicibacterium conceptionense]OBH96296.1 hypothetical protein A5716_19855 [Mycolicibacterium conceptionense]
MTYPPSNPGYPPQSGSQFDATQQFAKAVPASVPAAPATSAGAESGDNKMSEILLAVVAVAGLLIYLLRFAPLLDLSGLAGGGQVVSSGDPTGWTIDAAVLAALVAGVSLLPKQKNWTAVAAVISTFSLLSAIYFTIELSSVLDWGFYVILVLALVQSGAAIAALLFDAGIITPPAPKPQFDQHAQYGQYGGPSQYYGQQHQPQHGGQPYQQAQPQRPGYPSQYGGYSGAPNTGGFPVQAPQGQQGQQPSGPPTPPTGYPTYGQPQQQQSGSSAPTTAFQAEQQAQQSPSQQSGPASS